MKKVLVTGAAGFIGSNLCRKLVENGYKVTGIDDLSVGFMENIKDLVGNESFEFVKMDIRDLNKNEALFYDCYDVCYHMGARGETGWNENNPEEAVDINVTGTVTTIEACKMLGVKRFIFADTSAEYDNTPAGNIEANGGSIISDSEAYAPKGVYSITKNAASRFVRCLFPDSVIFRFFNVFGSAMNIHRSIPPVIGAFITGIMNNNTVTIYGDGEKRRDFIYIDDIVRMLVYAIEDQHWDDLVGGTYNAGTGQNYSVNEILTVVSELMGKEDTMMVWEPEQEHEAQVTLADMEEEIDLFDIDEFTSIDEGIRKTIESYV